MLAMWITPPETRARNLLGLRLRFDCNAERGELLLQGGRLHPADGLVELVERGLDRIGRDLQVRCGLLLVGEQATLQLDGRVHASLEVASGQHGAEHLDRARLGRLDGGGVVAPQQVGALGVAERARVGASDEHVAGEAGRGRSAVLRTPGRRR
jgi:hypothetical protein